MSITAFIKDYVKNNKKNKLIIPEFFEEEKNETKYVKIYRNKKYLEDNDSLLIPIGTGEQHGLHLPLCTDTIVAERICDEISEKYGILVAPTINYGVNLPLDNKTMTGTTGIS